MKQPAEASEKPPVAVDVAMVAPADITEGIEVVGTLLPKYQADIKSEYTGIVTDVYVTEWVRVSKGAPLAKLDTREAEVMRQKALAAVQAARAGLLQAEVAATRANREYDRFVKMKQVGLVTQQNLDDAASARDASGAQVAAAQAQIGAMEEEVHHAQTRLDKAVIRSPLDGVVALRGVNVGDLAGEMGSPRLMFQVVDNRILDLTVTVPSAKMDQIRLHQPLAFTTDALPGREFMGKVMFINPSVSEADRSVKVTAEVRNVPEVLKGGLFVKGRIVTGQRHGVLQVSRTALLGWDVNARTAEVFVADGQTAKRRHIQTGALLGNFVEVVSGLTPGETVVTRGSFNIKNGDRLTFSR